MAEAGRLVYLVLTLGKWEGVQMLLGYLGAESRKQRAPACVCGRREAWRDGGLSRVCIGSVCAEDARSPHAPDPGVTPAPPLPQHCPRWGPSARSASTYCPYSQHARSLWCQIFNEGDRTHNLMRLPPFVGLMAKHTVSVVLAPPGLSICRC